MWLAPVAQTSSLLYRGFPIRSRTEPSDARDFADRSHWGRPAGWKHCDTADWKSNATRIRAPEQSQVVVPEGLARSAAPKPRSADFQSAVSQCFQPADRPN